MKLLVQLHKKNATNINIFYIFADKLYDENFKGTEYT